MNFNRTAAIFLRQVYLIRGSVARFLPLFAWVTVDMTLWGFMSRYLNQVAAPGCYNFVPALLEARSCSGRFLRPRHAGRDDGVLRGRLVA